MRSSWRLVSATLSLALLVSCSSQAGSVATSPTSSAINCGPAAPVVSDPSDASLQGVRIGPIVFLAARDASGRALIPGFEANSPTKVVIQPVEPLTAALRLEGWRCSTGERLRIQFGGGPPTVAAALLPAGRAPNGAAVGYTGYMLFTAPGTWMIAVSTKNGHLIGRAVFSVASGA